MRRVAPPPTPRAGVAHPADAFLAGALAKGTALVERATAPGLAFALDELGDIELPEPAAARIDRAQLRALASIYLAADLEPAGIIVSVEQLASLSATGSLRFDLGSAVPLLEQWWRDRNHRMTREERNAFFAQLFGTSSGPTSASGRRNTRFEDRMLGLCEALTQLEDAGRSMEHGSSMAQARVRTAARALAHNLGDAGGGMTAFVASEVMQTLKLAFAILSNPDLRGPLHARDIWDVVRAIARLSRSPESEVEPYVRRGKAGMLVLSWLADTLEVVLGAGPVVKLGDPVIGVAFDWLDATLQLGEAVAPSAPAAPPPPARSDDPASVWSSLGG